MDREVTPRVSVGVPVLNGADTLSRTIESVLRQTFADFELIVSDNASQDGTDKVCRRYAAYDRRIRYARQPTTLGALDNFRFVLEQARAPYFMWLAADDYLLPTMLECAVNVLDTRPDVVCAVPRTEFVDVDGVRREAVGTFPLLGEPRRNLRRFLVDPNDNCRFYGLYRRDVIRPLLPPRMYYAFDWAVTGATLRYGKHVELPDVLLIRERGDHKKYIRSVDTLAERPLDRLLPLAPFTRALLGPMVVSRSVSVLYALLRLNVIHHLWYCEYRYPRYAQYGQLAYDVIARLKGIVARAVRVLKR